MSDRVWIQIDNEPPVPGEISTEQKWVDVTSISATKPDPTWEYIDRHGHFHAYAKDETLPTTETRSEHVECTLPDDHDECEGFNITYDVCAICGERIDPGRTPDPGPHTMPGRMTWEVLVQTKIERGRRVTVRAHLGGTVAFGVGLSSGITRTEGGPGGVKVTSRIMGAGPLGQRRAAARVSGEGGQTPSA